MLIYLEIEQGSKNSWYLSEQIPEAYQFVECQVATRMFKIVDGK